MKSIKLSDPKVLGSLCGTVWWLISLFIGAERQGIVGNYFLVGGIAGIVTGILVTKISVPIYRKSVTNLLWYTPLSVYLAIAIYGCVIFLLRLLLNDFHSNQIGWAVGLQSILGMWWGITFLIPIGIAVHLIAYVNHVILRTILRD